MSLVFLFGPPAAGKMTVGIELEKLTGFPMFHNHMTIDMVLPFFPYGDAAFNRLVGEFRQRVFEEVAASDHPGLIFTFVWALDHPGEREYVDSLTEIFTSRDREVCFVELETTLEERLRRNGTPLRLEKKASKRDLTASREHLMEFEQQYRFNTNGDFPYPDNHLKIENTELAPREVARRIVERFGLPRGTRP